MRDPQLVSFGHEPLYVKSRTYDEDKGMWMYKVQNSDQIVIGQDVPEKSLKRPSFPL